MWDLFFKYQWKVKKARYYGDHIRLIICRSCGVKTTYGAKGLCSKCYGKEYYVSNKDGCKEYEKEHYLTHKDGCKEYEKERYQENKDVWKEDYQKNKDAYKEYQREHDLRQLYDVDLVEFNQMIVARNNSCDICSNIFRNGRDRHMDHIHRCDENGIELPCRKEDIRGLLCRKHNLGLGSFKDDIDILQNAISYLNANYNNGIYDYHCTYKGCKGYEEFNLKKQQMRVEQNNRYAICGDELKDDFDCCLDHNHKTGVLRKVICQSCNKGLGQFNDNVILLQKAIDYLAKYAINLKVVKI